MDGKPPFDELRSLIEAAGFEVFSMGISPEKTWDFGAIDIKIAPKKWLEQTDFFNYPQVPQGLVSKLRECTAQLPRQEKGNDE